MPVAQGSACSAKEVSKLVCRGAAAGIELLNNTQLGAAAVSVHLQLCFTCMTAKCNHDPMDVHGLHVQMPCCGAMVCAHSIDMTAAICTDSSVNKHIQSAAMTGKTETCETWLNLPTMRGNTGR